MTQMGYEHGPQIAPDVTSEPVCDRCGRTRPGPEEPLPLGWARIPGPQAVWDLCPACVDAYTLWLDEPSRELEAGRQNALNVLRKLRAQIDGQIVVPDPWTIVPLPREPSRRERFLGWLRG